MKTSKSKIRKLIKESYQKMLRQKAELSRESGPGPYIFSNNSKKYLDRVRSYLYHNHGISSNYQFHGIFLLSNDYVLGTPYQGKGKSNRSVRFPHGFEITPENNYSSSTTIKFTVSGIPEIDAEFISKLCNLQGDHYDQIAALSKNGSKASSMKSWASKVMPGYPHKFVGL